MSKGPYPFKESDIRRALRAARKEDVDVRIEINTDDRRLSITTLKPGESRDTSSDLDKWLREHPDAGHTQGHQP